MAFLLDGSGGPIRFLLDTHAGSVGVRTVVVPSPDGRREAEDGNAPSRQRSGTVALFAEIRKLPDCMAVSGHEDDLLPSVHFKSDDPAAPPLPCPASAFLRGSAERRTGRFLLWNFCSWP
jgi:hypothetical protein